MPLAEVSFDKIGSTTRQLTKIKNLPAPQRAERLREGERIVAILAVLVYMKKPGGQFRN